MDKKKLTEADIRTKFITPVIVGVNGEKWDAMAQLREEIYFTNLRRARAALTGYVLRRWRMGCSPGHSLSGPEYWLWLRDAQALYGVVSPTRALGCVPPVDRG